VASFVIRAGQPRDLAALLAIEAACFITDRLSARQMRRFLTRARARLLVVEQPAQMADRDADRAGHARDVGAGGQVRRGPGLGRGAGLLGAALVARQAAALEALGHQVGDRV